VYPVTRLSDKYDLLADCFSTSSYANLEYTMHHRLRIALHWGACLAAGDRVLELGCGDGYLAELLVQHGLCYTGTDLSPRMVDVTRERLQRLGRPAHCFVADINSWEPSQEFDAVIAYMRAFFSYVADPVSLMAPMSDRVQKKLIVDLDPRRTPIRDGIEQLKQAGFSRVAWRPFLVPLTKRLPLPLLLLLSGCETVPLVRSAPLRWRFHVLLKAER
jgi:SAM-dependent methyltransferase